ncbi:MAG: hypothetical protein GEU88_15545 [Solirubrobacterales bacterium]|nr:hypothetical protein [Solirubrobacterales bacterium]
MSALRRMAAALRANPGVAAVVALGIAWGVIMHAGGWAQQAHFAEVRALASGSPEIDRWHWETGDKAWIDGHFYSVKSPGVAALSIPFYAAIDALGGHELARDAAANARRASHPRWNPHVVPPYASYGYDAPRAIRVQSRVEENTPILWALTLIVAVIPSVALLLGVRWLADRLLPGYGTAAAITLGIATMLMVFAAEYFSHAIGAALGFAAFAVLFSERAGPPRLALVAAGGLLAGLAVTFEYQTGLVGAVLFFYAALRAPAARLPRAVVYAGGALAGALPALAYNAWALGSPLRFAYSDAVAVIGRSGHAELGLNSDGFFGITLPRLDAALDVLVSGRGVLVLTPVLVAAAIGVVLMRRRGHRAEAWVIAGVTGAYLLYNFGYWQPLGGGTPGPRFLIPILPFLALGLAFAYQRLRALTLALAIPSAIWMVVASVTYPLIGFQGSGLWVQDLGDGTLEHTLLTALGVRDGWLALAPVLVAIGAAIVFAAAATPRARIGDIRPALAALAVWAAVFVLAPPLTEDTTTTLGGDTSALLPTAAAVVIATVVLVVLRYRERRGERAGRSERAGGELALSEPSP